MAFGFVVTGGALADVALFVRLLAAGAVGDAELDPKFVPAEGAGIDEEGVRGSTV